ncbi:SGNH/GDSL hydrolase family protein [Aureimonas glaciei]|uniref:DUF459 domain-containing protein n=1 Tax=Aureimonas glaciei TaxID=1776957 RepID=A0A916Y450_9HYPH|nr:SGNH family hydrolase [Aureimonas glaciei]GGD30497.1 hypothetical protein GCM10011335_36910 [Aureimonas glaciei]
MTEGRERMSGQRATRVAARLLLAFAVLISGLLPSTGAVQAQERPRSILDMLFGGPSVRQRERAEPPPRRVIRRAPAPRRQKPVSARKSGKAGKASSRATATAATGAAAAAAAAVVAKRDTARPILVIGDFLGGSLAAGLEAAIADRPDLKIVDASRGSSGLVREDHYDWPSSIPALLDKEKPALVVVMLGSNDRQTMETGSLSLSVRSAEWTAEYQRRATALAAAVGAKTVPLLWVGMPAFRQSAMTADMTALNEIYRQAATSVGGEFVDIWDGFVDADGAFTYSGPDTAGQQARLRNEDGITMTTAGRDKLAFFAENPILRILGADGAIAATSETPSKPMPVANPATATSAPLLALTDPALGGGDSLLGGAPAARKAPVASPRDRLVTAGLPGVKTPGRADAFAWNPKSPAVAPSTPAAPLDTADPVVVRGSVDINALAGPRQPPPPMPTLADAIIEDWSKSQAGPQGKPTSPLPAADGTGKSVPATAGNPAVGGPPGNLPVGGPLR